MRTALDSFQLVEASIADFRHALETGTATSVDLVAACLNRIGFYDRHGLSLNSVPVLNPNVFAEARSADERRRTGTTLGPLDGIPYTAKNSYKFAGMTVASGSPAFEHLVASDDAFTISQLRKAGAVLIGLTNMPPMAAGGMQRGIYGRAESPYNRNFLPSAFGSGSSNGSGVSTAASFAAFGLGEETWSSGRAPASHNGLVAYTPSRGVISMRGNWPLFATMDVVVPHTRSMQDMAALLNIIVADDDDSRGDFWRAQPHITLPNSSDIRPADYLNLLDSGALRGKRLGVPRMYINKDPNAAEPITTRASIIALWEKAAEDLTALGATVTEVDFPVVSNYERDRPGALSMVDRGLVPEEFLHSEMYDLIVHTWNDFLAANADPHLSSLADVDGNKIFPHPPGSAPDRYEDDPGMAVLVEIARKGAITLEDIPCLAEGLRGLEQARRLDLEVWLDEQGLDAVVFPTNADVAPYDADYNLSSNDIAWRNGVRYSNGNLAIRHLGIPTVTVPMGVMNDTDMPVGLTFAGKAYSDNDLLSYGYAFESARQRRKRPPYTPPLPTDLFPYTPSPLPTRPSSSISVTLSAQVSPVDHDGDVRISITGTAQSDHTVVQIDLFVDGQPVAVRRVRDGFHGTCTVSSRLHSEPHSPWRAPYGSLVMAVARDSVGAVSGSYTIVAGL
ncbi:amidase [Rhodococcus sp. MSC1_016]|jgi:amidase|uniref:amidase n=1 Tax=Rhodococcus sp. MSC1_016 TaxID=2909266 RepID=UPI00202EA99D|nr:amidase [Rhodococcus sp. MSC1_016]